jgi:hypothetical protein
MTAFAVNAKGLPAASAVYLLKSGGRVVYVGQSRNVRKRIMTHEFRKRADDVQVLPCPKRDLRQRERELIQLHRPPLNGTAEGVVKLRADLLAFLKTVKEKNGTAIEFNVNLAVANWKAQNPLPK